MSVKSNRPILERRFYPKDQVIIQEGDDGQTAYLIQSGVVSVFTYQGNRELLLTNLGPGEIFGEMSLLFGEPRSASVKAKKDCNLILINKNKLDQKLKASDPTIRSIVKALVKRIDASNKMISNKDDQVGDLATAIYDIFDKALNAMPSNEKREFRKVATPILEQFLDIIAEFNVNDEDDEDDETEEIFVE